MIVMKTMKNKLWAAGLVLAGLVPTVLDRDATFLVFAALFAVPLFFAKEDMFN